MDTSKRRTSLSCCCTNSLTREKLLLKPTHLFIAIILLHQLKPVQNSPSGYYFDNGLQTISSNRNLFDWQEQEKQISKELLHMLGLQKRPKISPGAKNHKSAPKFMLDLYKELQYDEEDGRDSLQNLNLIHYNFSAPGMKRGTGDADLIMSFENQASERQHQVDLLFDFSDVPATESVSRAELRIHKYPVKANGGTTDVYTVDIYKQAENGNNSTNYLVTRVTVPPDYSGWFDIEITDTVTQWLNFPYYNKGIFMTVKNQKDEQVPPESIGIINSKGPDELQTFLVAFFQAPAAVYVRQRRSPSKKQRKNAKSKSVNLEDFAKSNEYLTYTKCHKEALYIRFSDLRWQDWIIAPEGYAAFHCTGQCTFPLNAQMNATNHAIVQTLISLMDPYKVPVPYCTPVKMSAISVLYFDDKSNVILKKYKNMVVKTCGCN